MQVRADGDRRIVILEKGEEVVQTLQNVCEVQGIKSGVFHGIGAVRNTQLGYYDVRKKEYFFRTYPEDREVAALSGNVTLVDGKPFIHAHLVLSASDESLACAGGHLKECEVAVTLEVFISRLEEPLVRKMNEEIGLKLITL